MRSPLVQHLTREIFRFLGRNAERFLRGISRRLRLIILLVYALSFAFYDVNCIGVAWINKMQGK
jgi:hypothetical protein